MRLYLSKEEIREVWDSLHELAYRLESQEEEDPDNEQHAKRLRILADKINTYRFTK